MKLTALSTNDVLDVGAARILINTSFDTSVIAQIMMNGETCQYIAYITEIYQEPAHNQRQFLYPPDWDIDRATLNTAVRSFLRAAGRTIVKTEFDRWADSQPDSQNSESVENQPALGRKHHRAKLKSAKSTPSTVLTTSQHSVTTSSEHSSASQAQQTVSQTSSQPFSKESENDPVSTPDPPSYSPITEVEEHSFETQYQRDSQQITGDESNTETEDIMANNLTDMQQLLERLLVNHERLLENQNRTDQRLNELSQSLEAIRNRPAERGPRGQAGPPGPPGPQGEV
ncbi:hypothetical protein BDV28DRAFT_144649 [Aspergillus coremiiformis]|uniref:Uncharacterized protein n=1 Tax=Aspergillus coremiiformis TaxID=138285 RepID=A0A5N6ZID5_9EURO|nr:hypothetical protein BDV28DRAFT_144649 [Aspergillus coremiiformis]